MQMYRSKKKKRMATEADSDSFIKTQLLILILQFLEEENFHESLHLLEEESNIYFNMKYFGDTIIKGEWEKAENYLCAFTTLDDNLLSRKMIFKIRQHKYFEALCRNEVAEATAILQKELTVFLACQDENCELLSEILSSKWNDDKLSWYVNTAHARTNLQDDLKKLIEQNPIFQDKLVFPILNNSGLLSIMYLIYSSPENKTSIKEELTYLILQFLDEGNFKGTLQKLEQETMILFDVNYFGNFVTNGEWDKAEKYLSAFTKLDDRYPVQGIFEMQDGGCSEDFGRKNDLLSKYIDASSVKAYLFDGLDRLFSKYPVLLDKLKSPCMDKSRLLTIIKQTMEWWIPHYNNARTNPDNKTVCLNDVPTVPYLCHKSSVPISSSMLEQREMSIPCNNEANGSPCIRGSNGTMEVNCGIDSSVKIKEINEPSECCLLVLPDDTLVGKVAKLMYSQSGESILALAQDAKHKLWLLHDNKYSSGKALSDLQPLFRQPPDGQVMTNDVAANPENIVSCFALKGDHLLSTSGGRISIYDLKTFETINTFAVPPPVATYFIFLPRDIFAIGFDDSTILIRSSSSKKTKAKLEGHQKAITCLAFSPCLNVLVSSGSDGQLCVWEASGWEKLAIKSLLCLSTGELPDPPFVNYIEFHKDGVHLLCVHERQIDVYKAPELNHIMQSIPPESDLPITYATYSCDGQSIFASFKNGCIKVISNETFETTCRINLTAYTQPVTSCLEVYPTVLAAGPFKPNQIALGLSNGRVLLLEPLVSESEWGKDYSR
ncbi:hypothetical protein L6164_024322 [Bauhinia variegata]|uniref:Uncharacterized protein n=1 Tax=Bauhinia variegata TaxID=167791 RepID=A0ACB9LWX6_BAUVA|nr:hypothetical protein L6164_024322 [Bauhinia variegata]